MITIKKNKYKRCKMKHVYLDHNATTPPHSDISVHLKRWTETLGNPSSTHLFGRAVKSHVRQSRLKIAYLIGAKPLEIVFTSGGSESNNQIIKGVYFHNQMHNKAKNHFLVGAVEHPSTLRAFEFIESLGAKVETIPVDRKGVVDLQALKDGIRPDTALVSFMLAQNETGHIYPIKKMVKIAHQNQVLFHSDCVQGLGKIPLSVEYLGLDFASFSAHKFYALKGLGLTYIKTGCATLPLIHGGRQERSRRAGTENTVGMMALALMAEKKAQMQEAALRMQNIRDAMETKISQIGGITILKGAKRLCNTSCFIVDDIDGETLMINLDLLGFAVSTGAACSSGQQESSPALRAMGLTNKEAQSSLRISLGWNTTQQEADAFCLALQSIIYRLRNHQNKHLKTILPSPLTFNKNHKTSNEHKEHQIQS